MEAIVGAIPVPWGVGRAGREALVELICQRAAFLSANMMRLMASVWPEGEFPFMSEEEGP